MGNQIRSTKWLFDRMWLGQVVQRMGVRVCLSKQDQLEYKTVSGEADRRG